MTARLAADALVIGHRTPLCSPIDLAVDPAEIVAVVGPSGSGKSTLLATLAGVQQALGGRVLVDGRDVSAEPVHRRGVGLVFQEPLLFPHLSVLDNVGYGLRRRGLPRAEARRQAAEALAWVGLDGLGDRRPDQLSGGQAQRVALARAMAPRPSALLLDEPFSALDTDLRQRLAAEVAALLRHEGMAAIHVTHDLDEATTVADRVLRLDPAAPVPLVRVPR